LTRHGCGEDPVRSDADDLWDSMAVAHDVRWDLALPRRDETVAYMSEVRDRVIRRLREASATASGDEERLGYLVRYCVHHEDMHAEAFTYTRQTLGYPAPPLTVAPPGEPPEGDDAAGDVRIPGGRYRLGADPGSAGFVFDNEKWAHEVEVEPFRIARAPVTRAEFARFVEDGGYRRRELWSDEGWAWREEAGADRPLHWRRGPDGGWRRRDFHRDVSLEPHRPMLHVNWHEARAWCRWAGRRLPTEAEWELAAAGEPGPDGGLADWKRRYPWGREPPGPERVNMDWRRMGTVEVGALPEGDSAFGCRQMLGNVWEWTADPFEPYPGFEPDMYREYSEPWFHTRKVLRGGAWPTRSRLVRNTLRSYYTPDRRDVWSGFRTCAPRDDG
jgi:iron(II)-dependent oxidoreductase